MTLFWIISAAMIVAALGLLAPTLLRRHKAAQDATEQFNVDIARERLAELTKQKDAGELSDEEYAQAKHELELALAEDLQGTRTAAPQAPPAAGGRVALLVSVVLVPLITVPLYFEIGSPDLIGGQQVTAAPAGHGSGDLPPISELAATLRERLEAQPENAEGWFLLGRTYMRLQDYNQAVDAFERVVRLLPEEPAAMLSLADALTMTNGGRSGPRAIELLEKALTIDPNSVTALWLLGNAAMDQGDSATALDYWQRAYPLLAGEPAMQNNLGQMIRQAGGEVPVAAATLPPIMPTGRQATVAQGPQTEPAAGGDTTGGGADTAEAAGGAAITVEVALAPALLERAEPGDTVFVLARAEAGPPMPLAVARHSVDELPLRVTLTDAMAMMPALKLSSFDRVKISARVSKSGNAATRPGDMIAGDRVVDSADPPASVQLLIDQVVE